MEKMQVRCSSCEKKILFDARHQGRKAKCPNCATFVQLEPAPGTTLNTAAKIDDPFAEMMEPPTPAAKPTRRRSVADPDATPNVRKAKQADSAPADTTPIVKKKRTRPEPTPEELFQDDPSNFEPTGYETSYFDELGLGELNELRDDDAPDSSSLPPVQKRLLNKPKKVIAAPLDDDPVSAQPMRSPKRTSDRFDDDGSESSQRRWLFYGLFLMTLIPLGIHILMVETEDLEQRFAESFESAEANGELDQSALEGIEEPELGDALMALPGHKLKGAFLAHDTWMHWLFAGISGLAFTSLFVGLFHRYKNALSGAMIGAIFTATAGIMLLLCLQWAAFASQGVWIRGRSIIAFFFLIVKLIGFSYRCALEDGNGFLLSFFGFTAGVGICEEVCKILPVLVYLGTAKKSTWQGACFVGLASGVGFGVSEGISYSSSYYNGLSDGNTYLVRFVSCVALHAVWTGAGAVLIYFNQDFLNAGGDWLDMFTTLAKTLGVAIILHGLYDTLLKQEMPMWALLIGVLSVCFLIFVVEKQTQDETA